MQLKFFNISKKFKIKHVIKNISGCFYKGITGILGLNGAGKSTLLKLLTGLLPIDTGEIIWNEQKIDLYSQHWKKIIGYLPQMPGMYERMKIREYLEYILLLSRWKNKYNINERIEEILNIFDLKNYQDEYLAHISGGTRQRVAIAQAFIHNPHIVFLDEPTNNLDPEQRVNFFNFLATISERKIIVCVSHHINELAAICSKLLVLSQGELIFDGTPNELLIQTKQYIREALVDYKDFLTLNENGSSFLSLSKKDGLYCIHYDSRLLTINGEKEINPTIEESYKILLNTVTGKSNIRG
ncbi:MAG: ABC transporter ATP-binding protein [Melioribacter sp.]|uniref:ABC transporter ATP-binding protein n=1 Tax=Rosettibacter primus TaxID=3111523 RepID=UPI00247D4278|nr:ABC transporter ATP-binding protein [Melioribacter sp.]